MIRLCTDEESVVNYWNNVDSQLDVDMDVLDDFQGIKLRCVLYIVDGIFYYKLNS